VSIIFWQKSTELLLYTIGLLVIRSTKLITGTSVQDINIGVIQTIIFNFDVFW